MHIEDSEFNDFEEELLASLPKPAIAGIITTSNVWIVEWLYDSDRKTGAELHSYLSEKRPGWSKHYPCHSKNEFLEAIRSAVIFARENSANPILHLEAHGGLDGLEGPDTILGNAFVSWEELTPLLQQLNIETRANLVLVTAACTGFAAVLAAACGPQAPCIAIVGPSSTVNPSELLKSMKEFYRGWMGGKPKLEDIAANASRELTSSALIDTESFVDTAYQSMIELVVERTRPDGPWLEKQFLLWLPKRMQKYWNQLFMIDIYPENKSRLWFDVRSCIAKILDARGLM